MNDTVKRIINRLWIIPTMIICINGLPFIYIGMKCNVKKWIYMGIILEIPFLLVIITGIFRIVNRSLDVLIGAGLVFFPIFSLIYALIIRKEYDSLSSGKEQIRTDVGEEFYYKPNPTETVSQESIPKNNEISQNINSFDFDVRDSDMKISNLDMGKVNINTASYEEIEKLPGINIILTKKLQSVRQQGIQITDMNQLAKIWNLTPHHMKQLEPYILFDTEGESSGRRIDL